MQNDHEHLIAKLDAFIRKYYKDRLIRGALYSVGCLVLFFLAAAFWSTLVISALPCAPACSGKHCGCVGRCCSVRGVAFGKLFRLGEVISHAEAAAIIGTHFAEVKDKLLNTLQLREMASTQPAKRELIEAAIDQRSKELAPVPFVNAIDLGRNTRYLRYALPPLAILLVVLFAAPSLITGPAKRIIEHSSEFIPEAPFKFVLENDSLEVPEQQDFELVLSIEGNAIPQQVELEANGQRIPLVKKDATRFTHRFRNVQEAITFRFAAEGFTSVTYTLNTVPDPLLLDFEVSVEYPGYLGRTNETLSNTGDLVVPAGTRVTWNINARSSNELRSHSMTQHSRSPQLQVRMVMQYSGLNVDSYKATYRMSPRNDKRIASAPLQYRVESVPDLYPSIQVDTRRIAVH